MQQSTGVMENQDQQLGSSKEIMQTQTEQDKLVERDNTFDT